VLLAYLIGLISVSTGLLLVATAVTIKNYWLLRELLEGAPSGRHEALAKNERHFEYYDSGASGAEDRSDSLEWTGPVTPYTPEPKSGSETILSERR
jgi:hypothetical protein